MKKTAIIAAFIALSTMATAQNTIYRQNLSKEINVLNVFGDCTIILKLDTCNWIAYQGTEDDLSQNFFTVAGNIVQTTAAANGKTLSVGTTASQTNNSAPLVIDIKDNARVIFMGDTLRKGRHTRSFYSGTVENKKKGTRTEWGITFSDKTDNNNADTERDWTGLKKYTFAKRFHDHFKFGVARWINSNGLIPNGQSTFAKGQTTNSTFASDYSWQLDYSLYMDNHIAAGFGVEWGGNMYRFATPLITGGYQDGDYILQVGSSDLPGAWKTSANTMYLALPLHFVFYPNARKHSFNFRLDLIPRINIESKLVQEYINSSNDVTETRQYYREMPFNLFNLNARLSANLSLLGVYAEMGVTPIFHDVKKADGSSFNPFHMSIGVVFNLFDL